MTAAAPRVRILGIDPGLRITGFGVIDKTGNTLTYVTSGCIKTPSAGDLALRLKTILEGLGEVIDEARPDQVAIEKVFVNTNPQSTLLLGQARGTAICAAVTHELAVAEYTALQIKQAVVGNGHAAKEQVQDMVKRLLRIAATIVVERDGHKAMVIGDKGERIKRIGMETRVELEKLADAKVFLELWVKVRSGWADDAARVRSFGYE